MAVKFTVPEHHRELLEDLARLSDERSEVLCRTFESEDRTFLPLDQLVQNIANSVEEWPEARARLLVSALVSMLNAIFSHSVPYNDFTSNVTRSADLSLQPEDRKRLRDTLTRLLTSPVLEASGKAANIASENERNFHTARVLTQIRPIFRNDPTHPPLGGVVLHELHLNAWSDESDHTYVVTLSSGDLQSLQRVVERALAKSQSLENWLASVGFSTYQISTDVEGL